MFEDNLGPRSWKWQVSWKKISILYFLAAREQRIKFFRPTGWVGQRKSRKSFALKPKFRFCRVFKTNFCPQDFPDYRFIHLRNFLRGLLVAGRVSQKKKFISFEKDSIKIMSSFQYLSNCFLTVYNPLYCRYLIMCYHSSGCVLLPGIKKKIPL